MDKPLVSCVVSSYNRPRLIRDALDSILAQTWPNIELIICDDWSNIVTREVLNQYADKFDYRGQRFEVIKPIEEPIAHERQYGQRCSVCINAAMPYARGEFVAFLPDDDFLTPRSIEVRAQYLVDHPEVNAVYGRLEACQSRMPDRFLPAKIAAGIHYVDTWPKDAEHFTFAQTRAFPYPHLIGLAGETWADSCCVHDCNGFWLAEPIVRAANRLDHSMPMFRRWWTDKYGEPHPLPIWPEYCTDEVIINGESQESPYPPSDLEGFIRTNGERFDCPDAGFFFRCELAGLGPFHSVDEVVTVKRYHSMHHRTDPSRRE